MTATDSNGGVETDSREFSSFRDPSGHLFWRNGEIYRSVDQSYRSQFETAQKSGLFDKCVAETRMIPFEVVQPFDGSDDSSAVLKPRQISFVSYPYEWSFDQLKDAAIATLELHLEALAHDMVLKDASAYNIQFVDGRPCLIDHLSFDHLSEYPVWPAYGQFCRHFLAPLALMAHVDLELGKLMRLYIDGVPLDLASRLLPRRTKLSMGLLMHLHMHAGMVGKHAGGSKKVAVRTVKPEALKAIAQSLLNLVRKLSPKDQATEWGDYYSDTNYSDAALDAKQQSVRAMIERLAPDTVWDIGGNDGHFSRAISGLAQDIVCMDIDPKAVNTNYLKCKQRGVMNILPLVVDLTNPSPALGFANKERQKLSSRGQPDVIVALALIHHLAISNNLPFAHIAEFLAGHGTNLIIEFVPKSDSQVERLLLNRTDIFDDYYIDKFRDAFAHVFEILEEHQIPGTERTLFLLEARAH